MDSIALDFDGTIVTCQHKQMTLLKAVANQFHEKVDCTTVWKEKRSGRSTLEILLSHGMSKKVAGNVTDEWIRQVELFQWLQLDSVMPGLETLLKKLKEKYRLVLLTARNNPWNLIIQVRNCGLYDCFDVIDVVRPSCAATDKSSRLEGYRPLVFIGDTESDYRAARNAGVAFMGVASGQRSYEYLVAECIDAAVFAGVHDALLHMGFLP